MSDEPLDHAHRIAYLHGVMAVLMDELDRIYKPGRFFLWQMLEQRRGRRLLYQADAVLSEIARLMGEPRTPLPPIRRPRLIGHPLAWWYGQWVIGIWNACSFVNYALTDRWGFAAASLLALFVCSLWRVPPYRLAKQGKWHQ
jgi:hypothetical protein